MVRAAPTARNMKARGKRAAERSASPLDQIQLDDVALKGRNAKREYFALSGLGTSLWNRIQGRRAALRYALAPGYHMPRPWRSGRSEEGLAKQVLYNSNLNSPYQRQCEG